MKEKIFHHVWGMFVKNVHGITVVLILLMNDLSIFSQPSYKILFSSRNYDEVCGPVACTQNGEIFFILWNAKKPNWTFNDGSSRLYKIDNEGDTTCWNYQKPDTVLYYLALLYDNSGNLVIGGDAWSLDTAGNKTSKFQWFCKLTTDFDIIWQKIYRIQTTGDYGQNQSIIVSLPDNQYLYANSLIPDTSYTDYTYLFKIDSNGDSLFFFHNDNELKNSILNSITISTNPFSLGLHVWGGTPPPDHSTCRYIVYDSIFQLSLSQWYQNPDFRLPYNTINYTTTRFISCGLYWPLEKEVYPERYIRVMKMNDDLTSEDYIDLTYPDTDKPTYAAWYHSIDYLNPGRIFVGGMEDKGSTHWNTNPSWVYVACLNENLDIINEEYVGGDALYETYYVKATYDGGVILTGSQYNDSIQDHERDGFLMKFDSAMFVSLPELIPNIQLFETHVFPNPGQDFLNVQSSTCPYEFYLFNVLGVKVISQKVETQTIIIPTASLQSGIYYWLSNFGNSNYKSGKWIKN